MVGIKGRVLKSDLRFGGGGGCLGGGGGRLVIPKKNDQSKTFVYGLGFYNYTSELYHRILLNFYLALPTVLQLKLIPHFITRRHNYT